MISIRHPFTARHRRSSRSVAVAALGLALFTGGCQNIASLTTAAPIAQHAAAGAPAPKSEAEWRTEAETMRAAATAPNPDDPAVGDRLRAGAARQRPARPGGRRCWSRRRSTIPRNTALLGAYGRALADVGNYKQALDVLDRAHTPDQPDWRILSAQGAVLDQTRPPRGGAALLLERAEDRARRPVGAVQSRPVLRARQGPASAPRRRCGGPPQPSGTDPRVRQNLALVVGLQGRFAEAESIARADLPPEEAAANVAYLRQMLSQQNDLKTRRRPRTVASAAGPEAA